MKTLSASAPLSPSPAPSAKLNAAASGRGPAMDAVVRTASPSLPSLLSSALSVDKECGKDKATVQTTTKAISGGSPLAFTASADDHSSSTAAALEPPILVHSPPSSSVSSRSHSLGSLSLSELGSLSLHSSRSASPDYNSRESIEAWLECGPTTTEALCADKISDGNDDDAILLESLRYRCLFLVEGFRVGRGNRRKAVVW